MQGLQRMSPNDLNGLQWTNHIDYGEILTFPLAHVSGQNVHS